jgi:hypothetical protein
MKRDPVTADDPHAQNESYPQPILSSLIVFLARVAHEANRAYCKSIGDPVPPDWDDAPIGIRTSIYAGALGVIANPGITPEQSHEAWIAHKLMEGWRYGEVKSYEDKTHQNMVPWQDLSPEQRFKDVLFTTIIKTATNGKRTPRTGVAGEDIQKGSNIVEKEGLWWQANR